MASWTKRPPTGISTRRKWDLEDRNSLKNLKTHFAANECPDMQYDFAKQLLLDNPMRNDTISHRQGIYWLLSAARQGHQGALELLQDCYNKRLGINEHNEVEVRECLSMTPGERAARKAARDLFACLSNGEEHITAAQLERKMRKIYNLQKKRRRRSDSTNSSSSDNEDKLNNSTYADDKNDHIYVTPSSSAASQYNNETNFDCTHQNRITEANLVTAAVNYSHGRLPVVNDVMTVSVPHPNSLDHVPCFHRIVFHPIMFLTLLYYRFVNIISAFPSGNFSLNFKLFLIALLYTMATSDNFASLGPLIIYYITLGAMIWSTFKMLKTKHDFIDFRIWSGLFLSYGDNNVDANGSENQFLRNNMKPYLYFFCAFVTNLIIYPIISNEWLPHSEITVVSFILVFVTLITFMYTSRHQFPDFLILISFGINVLAKYPYEMDSVVTTGWRFLDLKVPTFGSFVIGNGIEFCLNCRAVFYLLIPGILLHIAKRINWHGTYTYLIPHCVTLSWLQMCIISSQSATMFGLMRATLGLAGILLFLPLFGIITVMIPIYLIIEWFGFTSDLNTRKITTAIVTIVAIIVSCLMAINKKTQKYITTLQITTCVIAATLLTLPYMTSNFTKTHQEKTPTSMYEILMNSFNSIITVDDKQITVNVEDDILTPEFISWETFYNYCGQPAWDNSNKIEAQLRCSQLDGAYVKWDGTVINVEIVKVTNLRATIIQKFLPTWIGNLLKCYYGDKNKIDCTTLQDQQSKKYCEEIRNYITEKNYCNLNKWNTYEYEIKIRMNSGILRKPSDIYLKVAHEFGNFTKNLSHSDRVTFTGRLINVKKQQFSSIETTINENIIDMILGTDHPIIELIEISCLTCHNNDLKSFKIYDNEMYREKNLILNKARFRDLIRGIKYFLNVLFNPIIIFK